MAKPNLALIPATIGDKVYSILPNDGVGDFDFTRASTATRINAQGLIETVASGENRLNYSLLDGEVVGCPHLLLEPSRTNYLYPSNGFSSWTSGAALITRTANYGISPDGTLNSTRADFANGAIIYRSPNRPQSDYVFSVFAKNIEGGGSIITLRLDIPSIKKATFDLSNGTIVSNTSNDAKIEYYGNGWYRCILIQNNVEVINAVIGEGTTELDCELFGAMLEEGSYPTSYIKTTTAAVTRAAETCDGSGNAATFNDSEGVLMAEISALANDNTGRKITLNNGSNSQVVVLEYTSTSNQIRIFLSNGSLQFNEFITISDLTEFNKIAIKYKENDSAIWVNGLELATSLIGTTFSSGTLTSINFDDGSGFADFYGNTKQIQYFDTTDIDLEQLTSWDSFRAMAEGQLYTIE
jgi:hypothetical protein